MHQGNFSHLQGTLTPWTNLIGVSHRLMMGLRTAPLCARLLLVALLVPGTWSVLDDEQEELLVELHNHYRGQVSPSAAAMLPLKWDGNLKVIAESYASKCSWQHNPDLEDTGENLFAGTGHLDLREAVEKWFLERLYYTYGNNSCDDDMMCGHYTQMVWADTHRIGCAVHLCNTVEQLEWTDVHLLVCNYFPAGNYEDQRPYVEGEWCSSCPENLGECENRLCAPEKSTESPFKDEPTTVSFTRPDILTASNDVAEVQESVAVTPTISEKESEDTPSPWSALETVSSPGLQPATLGTVEDPTDGDEEEEQRKESVQRLEETKRMSEPPRTSAASVLVASFLLACLTGLLTLDL
ncbi:peptidase inhibitor 16 isoform X1 [Oryzias melastigma]|nr:peptidase inhibitor 16 isoform X1 [Oryzias melastigma]